MGRSWLGASIQQVGGDECAEQQALRREEHPHRELGVRQAGGGLECAAPWSAAAIDRDVGHRYASPDATDGSIAQRVEPDQRDQHAGPDQPPRVDDAVAHDRHPEGRHERPVRGTRQVDAVPAVVVGSWPFAAPACAGTSRPVRSSSTYLRCQNSSRAWTVGISSKLCTGGGDGVIHSSVRASQGSSVGGLGLACWVTHDVHEEHRGSTGRSGTRPPSRPGSRTSAQGSG